MKQKRKKKLQKALDSPLERSRPFPGRSVSRKSRKLRFIASEIIGAYLCRRSSYDRTRLSGKDEFRKPDDLAAFVALETFEDRSLRIYDNRRILLGRLALFRSRTRARIPILFRRLLVPLLMIQLRRATVMARSFYRPARKGGTIPI